MARLGDICEILDSKRIPITAADRIVGPYPYYGANGVQDYVNDYIFDDELVLVAEDGGHFNDPDRPIAYRVSGKCWVNNHAHVLKPKNKVDVDYLGYALMYHDVSSIVNGATRQKLNQADLRKIEIPLPSLQEQIKITQKLKRVFELITDRKAQLAKIEQLVKSQFIEMFGDPILGNMKWNTLTFGDICKVRQGLQIPISKRLTHYEENSYEYITVAYIHGIKEREYIKAPKTSVICNKNDVLMTRTGNTGLVVTDVEGVFHNNFFLVDFNRNAYKKEFIVEYLRLESVQKEIKRRAGTSTIPDLNHGEFYKIPLPDPPISEQEKFSSYINKTNKLKFAIQQSLEQLETLKKSLMQEYFG